MSKKPPSPIKHLDHLNLSVASFDETLDWYGRVFGFELVERGTQDGEPWGVIRAGDALLCIYQRPDRGDIAPYTTLGGPHRVHHFGLRITDREAWEATVEREDLEVDYGGAVDWPHSTSWYVKDPTGHQVEVALWRGDEVAFG
jgi:catechol 2,3-dioxygenase-like lactoylglutathione lyase family enzyme